MDIATVNTPQIATASAPSAASQETRSAGTMISSDFETFLRMLTVQMQNQDPLNPIESSDYAVQLATFSGVEQQVKTNDLLTAVSGQLGAMSMSDLAGWVGMEARAVVPAWFDDTPITLNPRPVSGTQTAQVVVRDAQGNELDRLDVPVSDEPLLWAGVDPFGNPYPVGQYSFYLLSMSQGEVLAEEQMAIYSEITEARTEKGETVLVFAGGAEVPASEIDALRAPEAGG